MHYTNFPTLKMLARYKDTTTFTYFPNFKILGQKNTFFIKSYAALL
jgi:hypothetical protein